MAEFVLFRLEAPIAAFGNLAPGERRVSGDWPLHSAIAGLLGGALGITRDDLRMNEVTAGFHLAARKDRLGAPLSEFHTAQTPPQKRGRSFPTRREELALRDELNTMVSIRQYWTDAAFTLALVLEAGFPAGSGALVEALNRPAFAPYAGRRACPLSSPMAAALVEAETLPAAFDSYTTALNTRLKAGGLGEIHAGNRVQMDKALHACFPPGTLAGYSVHKASDRQIVRPRSRPGTDFPVRGFAESQVVSGTLVAAQPSEGEAA